MRFSLMLFELGSLQVFTYLSVEQALMKKEDCVYDEIYWQDKVSKHTFGPFKTIYDCMTHYTETIASQKKAVIGEEWTAPVIYVDFVSKSRVVYGQET